MDVTAGLVRRLPAGQHPGLAHLPRRTLGAQILVHEQRWLPLLAPRLPLPFLIQNESGILPMVNRGSGASCRTCRGSPLLPIHGIGDRTLRAELG